MEKKRKNLINRYLIGSSILYIYILIISFFFGNIEETSYLYPFYIPFGDFRFYGFPIIFITGAFLYLSYYFLLKLTPKLIYLHFLTLSILFSYFYTTLYFKSPMFSLPFYILFIGGFLFFWLGAYIKNEKLIVFMFVVSIVSWLSLIILPPIL